MASTLRHTGSVKSLSLALLFALGCGSSAKPTTTTTTTTTPPAAEGDPTCPLLVPGTSVSVEDTAEGPAFVFVTTGDVAGVRTRGTALAAMHNGKSGPAGAMGMAISGASTATAAEIEGGVRVIYKATDAANAGALANELHMHGGHLAGGSTCVMSMHH